MTRTLEQVAPGRCSTSSALDVGHRGRPQPDAHPDGEHREHGACDRRLERQDGSIVSRKTTMADPPTRSRRSPPRRPSAAVGSLDHPGEVDLRLGGRTNVGVAAGFASAAYAGRPPTGVSAKSSWCGWTGSARSLPGPRAEARTIVPAIRVSGTGRALPLRGAGAGAREALLAAGADAVSRRTVGRELHASAPRMSLRRLCTRRDEPDPVLGPEFSGVAAASMPRASVASSAAALPSSLSRTRRSLQTSSSTQ